MTDITELAQRMSIERIKQIALGSTPTMGERESLAITALHFAEELKIATDAFQAAGLAQLAAEEALEKAQQRNADLEESHAQVIQTRDHYKRILGEGLKQLAESRTVTVNPMRPGHITVGEEKIGIYMRDEVDEFMAALTAAGIKVEAK